MAEQIEAESLIRYPSYKAFDDFIDLGKLKSLDGYITDRLKERVRLHNDLAFYTGPYRLDESAPDRPGSRMVYLSHRLVLIVILIWIRPSCGSQPTRLPNSRC